MGKSTTSSRKKKSRRIPLRKKSTSRRVKSKKSRRRDDSTSFSDDDSEASISVSSSSSEASYRSIRGRSRTQRDGKGSKKRVRRQSSEDTSQKRKRKRSKKDEDYKETKKGNKKKKRSRRNIRVDPTSSGSSRSSSPSRGEIDEIEFRRQRGRSRKKESDRRNTGKVKKSRYRSRSCSSRSRSSQVSNFLSEDFKEETAALETNYRRLRSVITVVGDQNEGKELGKDKHKEEITYDYDDYPCRSNDSNDGGNKRESDFNSNIEIPNVENNASHDKVETEDPIVEKNGDFSGDIGSTNDVDLETMLRQRALENLKKFRGGLLINYKSTSNTKSKNDNDSMPPSTAKVGSVLIKGTTVVVGSKSLKEESSKLDGARQDPSFSPDEILHGRDGGDESNNDESTLKQGEVDSTEPIYVKPSVMDVGVDKTECTLNQGVVDSVEPTSVNSLVTDVTIDKSVAQKTDHESEDTGNKTERGSAEGSQFEQKTMSVMRGGEMVQVSYKVYIPKKAPALSRRPLKR